MSVSTTADLLTVEEFWALLTSVDDCYVASITTGGRHVLHAEIVFPMAGPSPLDSYGDSIGRRVDRDEIRFAHASGRTVDPPVKG